MALRVLTRDERESLLNHQGYKTQCELAAIDYADYWASHDGAGLATEALRIKWAKDRMLGVSIKLQGLNDSTIADTCLRVSKALQVDLGTAPVVADDIVDQMKATNKFDELISLYFDLRGEGLNFTFGGN